MTTLTLSVPNCTSSSSNMPSMKDLDFMTDTEIAMCLTKEERKAIGVKVLSSKLGTGGFKLSSGPKRYCDACRLPLLTKPGDLREEFCAICEEIKKTLIEKMILVDTTSQATTAMFSPIVVENSAVAKGKHDNVGVVDDSVAAEERIIAQDKSHTMNEEGSTDVTQHDKSDVMNEYKGCVNVSHDNSHIVVNEHLEGESVVDNGETTIAQQSNAILPNEYESQADIAGNVVFDATAEIFPNENEYKEIRFDTKDENISDDRMGNSVREDISHKKSIVSTNSFSAMCAVTLSSLICHHESVCNGGNDVGDHPQEIMDTKVIPNDTNIADEDKNEMSIIEDASEDADEFDAQLNNLVGNDQTTQTEEASSNDSTQPTTARIERYPSDRLLVAKDMKSISNYELFLSSMVREKEEIKILLGCTASNQKYIARPSHIRFHSI